MILAPRRPTFARYRRFVPEWHSLCRSLEREAIGGLPLKGVTLDVGGGADMGYVLWTKVEGTVETLNINASLCPTYVADANGPFPIEAERYDNVLSANTLEHVYNDKNCIEEITRVLKRGGRLYVLVPFLFAVHGSPEDHHRHTADFWERRLAELGYEDIVIDPLVWSPWVTATSLLGHFRGMTRLRNLLMFFDAWRMRRRRDERLSGSLAESYAHFAHAYFLSAKKKS